jgi:hypothetical protein
VGAHHRRWPDRNPAANLRSLADAPAYCDLASAFSLTALHLHALAALAEFVPESDDYRSDAAE